jgi:hypothetical protein
LAVTLAHESVASIWDEAQPLASAHHSEVGCLPDSDFEMNKPLYDTMERAGLARVFTARDQGTLIGYAVLMACFGPCHYRRVNWATQDSIFVSPDHRGPMVLRFLLYQDLSLKAEGFHVVYRHDTLTRPYGRILLHIGYKLNDRGYVRDLREAA